MPSSRQNAPHRIRVNEAIEKALANYQYENVRKLSDGREVVAWEKVPTTLNQTRRVKEGKQEATYYYTVEKLLIDNGDGTSDELYGCCHIGCEVVATSASGIFGKHVLIHGDSPSQARRIAEGRKKPQEPEPVEGAVVGSDIVTASGETKPFPEWTFGELVSALIDGQRVLVEKDATIAELRAEVALLKDEVRKAPRVDLAPLKARIEALEAELAKAKKKIDAYKTLRTLGEI